MTAVADGTAGSLLNEAARDLGGAGIVQARLEARLLLCAALSIDPADLVRDPARPVDPRETARFRDWVARRRTRQPLAQILGKREFWSLTFEVTGDTLDPRPDSETLIEAAVDLFPDRHAVSRILDFGAGSGCLLLAALVEFPAATGMGIDAAAGAVTVAQRNAARLGLAARASFLHLPWEDFPGHADGVPADLVLANPPYIPTGDIDALAPEVARYEPRLALDGGADGLDAYRCLLPVVRDVVADAGRAIVEIGAGQSEAVTALAMAVGLRHVRGARDLGGHERALVFARC